MDVEGLKPGAEYGDLRPELVDRGEQGTEEWDHRGFTKRNPLDVRSVDDREQVGWQV